MVYDIATADHMYNSSLNFTGDARTGDNTYKYADKVMAIHTIVDGGGTDTIDASAVTNANRSSTINLTPGASRRLPLTHGPNSLLMLKLREARLQNQMLKATSPH